MLQDAVVVAGARPRRDPARVDLAGLLCGAAALVRPAMLFYLPLATLWLAATRRYRLALALAGAAMLAICPGRCGTSASTIASC